MFRLLLLMVAATLLVANVVQAEDDDDSMSMDDVVQALDSFTSNCEPKPTREQIEELILNKNDAQPGTKCLRYCLMEQFELVKEGSTQLIPEKTKEMMEMAMPDNEEAVNEIIEKCNKKNAAITEKCEAAHEHGMCILDEFKARNVKMPVIKQ